MVVSIDTGGGEALANEPISRIESEMEVRAYLQNLKYTLTNGAKLTFQENRIVDQNRELRFTNNYTMTDLFPDENPSDVLRRELATLTVAEYLRTTKDLRFPKKSEMREFGRTYYGRGEVYMKIRVELLSQQSYGDHFVYVMSFHYAQKPFCLESFPYGKK